LKVREETAMDKFEASHVENADLARRVREAAEARHLGVRHNVTNFGNFAGIHRYVLFTTPEPRNVAYNSKEAIDWYDAASQKYNKPSVKGEAEALRKLLQRIINTDKEKPQAAPVEPTEDEPPFNERTWADDYVGRP
jgi:hypothetical protein